MQHNINQDTKNRLNFGSILLIINNIRTTKWGGGFLSPFSNNSVFYLNLIILGIVPFVCNVIYHRLILSTSAATYGIGYVINRFFSLAVEDYIIVLIISLVALKFRRVAQHLKWFSYIIIGLFCILNTACLISLNSVFSRESVFLIKQTNPAESSSFFTHYFSPTVWTVVVGIFLIIGSLIYLNNRYLSDKRLSLQNINIKTFILSIIFLLSVIMFAISSTSDKNHFFSSRRHTFKQFGQLKEVIIELLDNPHALLNPTPQLITTHQLPANVIVIIGESTPRDFMSLYGYNHNTTPRLDSLRRDSLIYSFSQVVAPACLTNYSFRHFMTTNDATTHDNSTIPYYKCETFPEIAKSLGYTTTWISNQTPTGRASNIEVSFANLCDIVEFSSDESIQALDETLIQPLAARLAQHPDSNFIFINTMGSHEVFEDRLPHNFSRFTPEMFNEYDSSFKREQIAALCNTIAYSDSVMVEYLKQLDNIEALVVFFPDHGLDMFVGDSNICGHGNADNPASVAEAIKIPLFFYATEKYKEKFPEQFNRIKTAEDIPFNTTNIIPTMLDLMGVEFIDKPDYVKSNSLFRSSYSR